MKCLRRTSRLLASLLLLASPAVGGMALPLVHPCPVAAPWAAAATTSASGHADGHAAHAGHRPASDPTTAPAPGHAGHDDCSCIGTCSAPPALAAPHATLAARPTADRPATGTIWSVRGDLPATRNLRGLLPPPTAPPLA